jgi:outer membrane immunogenic protein
MNRLRKFSLRLVALLLLSAAPAFAQHRTVDLGGAYTYERTNLLPGCACFSLNGGSANFQLGLTPHLAVVADFAAATRGGITPDNYHLTQLTYTAGVRYLALSKARISPFVEVLLGGAHTMGTLAPRNTLGASSNAFALRTGGGILLPLGSRWTLVQRRQPAERPPALGRSLVPA